MILLDTHALLWYRGGTRLNKKAMDAIADASKRRSVAVSAISAWEIGMLAAKQRVVLGASPSEYIRELFRRIDIVEITVTAGIAARAAALSGRMHGDPADHILVATAIELDCPFVTRDKHILNFARSSGAVVAIGC